MPPGDESITELTLNSTRVEFGSATLHRSADVLPSGPLGSPDWQLEIMNGHLPDGSEDVRVEVSAGGVAYTGAGRVAERANGTGGRTRIVANGPLISYTRRD